MDIDIIIQKLSEPERLIDPREISTLQSYLNGHITDLEESAWELQLVASNKMASLLDTDGISVNKAEVLWKVSQEFINWKKAELNLKKLKRYRSDLKDRFAVLMGTKRY